MKLAIGYSTKNQLELTEQTWPSLVQAKNDYGFDIFWCDASDNDSDALRFYLKRPDDRFGVKGTTVFGGADAAIAWKLSTMLASPEKYTHIGLLENDVLLDDDWLQPTLELFSKGKKDGLAVGAVSPRSFVDRVLIQRDGYAVMHNLGAGCVIFTRDAAEIVLRTLRTGWWPDNVRLFAQLSGIDLRTYAAFRGNEQWVTTDWTWDAQLARRGLASLATTPARCTMIGQNPSLEQQGLELATGPNNGLHSEKAFNQYRDNLARLRAGDQLDHLPMLHRQNGETLIFPHQLPAIGATWQGNTELKWSQGYGPFAYRAGPGGATLRVHVSGICSFQCTGGDAGAKVTLTDRRSGFKFEPQLPAGMDSPGSIAVPGGPIPREITLEMEEGAVFFGLSCNDPQMIDTSWKFDWSQLPEAG